MITGVSCAPAFARLAALTVSTVAPVILSLERFSFRISLAPPFSEVLQLDRGLNCFRFYSLDVLENSWSEWERASHGEVERPIVSPLPPTRRRNHDDDARERAPLAHEDVPANPLRAIVGNLPEAGARDLLRMRVPCKIYKRRLARAPSSRSHRGARGRGRGRGGRP